MFSSIALLVLGFVGGFVTAFFVAKNNKGKAIAAINADLDALTQEFLDSTDLDEKLMDFVRQLKAKLFEK